MSLCPESSQEDNSPESVVESSSSYITPEDEERKEVGQSHHHHHHHEQEKEGKKEVRHESEIEQQEHQQSVGCSPGEGGSSSHALLLDPSSSSDATSRQAGVKSQDSCLPPSPRLAPDTSSRSLDPRSISTADVDPDFVLDYRPETVDFPESPRLLSPSSLHIKGRQREEVSLKTSFLLV